MARFPMLLFCGTSTSPARVILPRMPARPLAVNQEEPDPLSEHDPDAAIAVALMAAWPCRGHAEEDQDRPSPWRVNLRPVPHHRRDGKYAGYVEVCHHVLEDMQKKLGLAKLTSSTSR